MANNGTRHKKGKEKRMEVVGSYLFPSMLALFSSLLTFLSLSSLFEPSSRRLLIYQRWFRVRSSFQFIPGKLQSSPSAWIPVTPPSIPLVFLHNATILSSAPSLSTSRGKVAKTCECEFDSGRKLVNRDVSRKMGGGTFIVELQS